MTNQTTKPITAGVNAGNIKLGGGNYASGKSIMLGGTSHIASYGIRVGVESYVTRSNAKPVVFTRSKKA